LLTGPRRMRREIVKVCGVQGITASAATADRELPRERDPVLRALGGIMILLAVRRAHGEVTRRHHDHLWAGDALLECILRLQRPFALRRQRARAARLHHLRPSLAASAVLPT
jgi:hypothetical protein